MRLLLQLFALLVLGLNVTGCDREIGAECFDQPDKFAANLQSVAKSSLPEGSTLEQVRQFCVQKRLMIVERDSLMYCTAEAHRALSRCDASLRFEFAKDGTLKAIYVEKPRIKNP